MVFANLSNLSDFKKRFNRGYSETAVKKTLAEIKFEKKKKKTRLVFRHNQAAPNIKSIIMKK